MIAIAAQERSRQLRLTGSGYVGILIGNYEVDPFPLEAQAGDDRLARVSIGTSWRGDLRKRTERLARAAGLNPNAFVEALIAAELLSPALHLTIKARGPKPKIQI